MAYSLESHSGFVAYDLVMQHTSTGIKANITVNMLPNDEGIYPSEAQRDSLFQGFLTRLNGMAGATVISASKTGSFQANVTP